MNFLIFVYIVGLVMVPLIAGFGSGAGWWKVSMAGNNPFGFLFLIAIWPVICIVIMIVALVAIPIIGAVALGKWVFDNDEEEGE